MSRLSLLVLPLGLGAFIAAVVAGTSDKVISPRLEHPAVLRRYDGLAVVQDLLGPEFAAPVAPRGSLKRGGLAQRHEA